jgi:hypothetical protein
MSDYSRNENVGPGERIIDAVWRNPEGLLLLAAGAALLMRRGVSSSNRRLGNNQFRPRQGNGDVTRNGSTARNLGDRAADAAHSAGEYASDVADKVSQAASAYASSVSDYADHAADRSLQMARDAQTSLQSTAQQILQKQPLAVAIAGLAAGAAVAAAFPASDLEKRALGPTGDRLKDAAGRVGENLKEASAQAGQSLMDAADERGLNREGIAEVAREVGDVFSGALAGETTGKAQSASSPSPKQAKDRTTGQTSGSQNPRSASNTSDKRGPR